MRILCWLLGHSWAWVPVNGFVVEKCTRCGRVYQVEPKQQNLDDL